jgi:hypothetical protein
MPRRAVGHRRAVTALTVAPVAYRAAGIQAEVTFFESMLAGFASASTHIRAR